MKKYYNLSLIISAFIMFTGCADNSTNNQKAATLDEKYKSAVLDAMIADSNEISNALIPVIKSNSYIKWQNVDNKDYVLAVTFTKYKSSYPVNQTIDTKWGEVWVTIVPEMLDFFKNYQITTDSSLQLRINQLLGMPVTATEQYLVEMWVKPEDLFRPSPDNEITDTRADLVFPKDVNPDYVVWYNSNVVFSYFPEVQGTKYPWTRLGYTYDWGNPENEKGLSEFVLRKNSQVIVKSVKSAREYILSVN
jgi:hypothetical protein